VRAPIVVALALLLAQGGCRTAYYEAWEQLGSEKRDLLRRDVDRMKDQQEETAEQFQDALTKLRALYGSSGSELEQRYDATKSEYEDCEAEASDLRARIADVRSVARDLFAEWEREIDSMESAAFKQDSRAKLAATRKRFETLDASMRRSEDSLDPVLRQFRDQVLYLKHNLNARSLGQLEGEVKRIDQDVNALVERMQKSIREADSFLGTLDGGA
jgi:predicted  nucleic acid-binding Zn-ribbon protein